jgi:hypothetical protein
LYGVVSQISNFCFETKKFCVTTEFVVLTLLAKFTGDKLDNALFVAGLAIPVCFWFLDAVAYHYQVAIRGAMEAIRGRIKSRNGNQLVGAAGQPVIAPERIARRRWLRVVDSGFNHSMWLYALLVAADLVVWTLFANGAFK